MNCNNPSISIIVTTYNQADTLPQTLDSILAQKTSYSFEVLIGDDCSTDNTQEICLKYSSLYPDIVKPFHYEKNGGVATNFVLTVREARGKYIALCAADDYWHNPNKIQLQVDYFMSHPDCGFLYTDYDKLHVGTHKITSNYLTNSRTPIYEGPNLIKTVFAGKFAALTLTVMFRKELFDAYIPWKDYIHYRFTLEDWPTWLIFTKYTSVGYLPISTATYRYGHESISNPKSYEKVMDRFSREKVMFQYLCERFPGDLVYNENEYDQYIYSVLLSLAYKRADYLKAKEFARKMIDLGDTSIRTNISLYRLSFYAYLLIKKLKS